MNFKYIWENKEANFGPTIKEEVRFGTHISCECILKYNAEYIALRRPSAIPDHELPPKSAASKKGLLYFVHNLPRWGETTNEFIKRIVVEQSGVEVNTYRIVNLTMEVYENTKQWAITPHFIVKVESIPKAGIHGNEVTEVVMFNKTNIPDEFGWWTKKSLTDFLIKFD